MRGARHCLLLLGLLASALSTGCEARAAETRTFMLADLPGQRVTPSGQWESSAWTGGTWLDYPGRITLRLEHGLGREPSSVLVYLAFDAAGQGPALAAGDLSRVVSVDAQYITVRNDTEGDYFARVVAE